MLKRAAELRFFSQFLHRDRVFHSRNTLGHLSVGAVEQCVEVGERRRRLVFEAGEEASLHGAELDGALLEQLPVLLVRLSVLRQGGEQQNETLKLSNMTHSLAFVILDNTGAILSKTSANACSVWRCFETALHLFSDRNLPSEEVGLTLPLLTSKCLSSTSKYSCSGSCPSYVTQKSDIFLAAWWACSREMSSDRTGHIASNASHCSRYRSEQNTLESHQNRAMLLLI